MSFTIDLNKYTYMHSEHISRDNDQCPFRPCDSIEKIVRITYPDENIATCEKCMGKSERYDPVNQTHIHRLQIYQKFA